MTANTGGSDGLEPAASCVTCRRQPWFIMHAQVFPPLRCYDSHMRFIQDDKLPTDVVRKEYSESRHALCCLNCGFESEFAPHLPDSIGKPLYVLMVHNCPSTEAVD